MKDLQLTRSINILAAGSLLMTAAACDSSGGVEADIKSYCKAMVETCADEVESDYDSVADCEESINEYIDEYTESEGAACGKAMGDLLSCRNDELQDGCKDPEEVEACVDEYEHFEDLCY